MEHKFNYKWTLKDANFTKDKGKVFSCFACGGGSTMGYKLAGFDVIGCNEIDKKMIEIYKKNHNPKYAFCEPIQEFNNKEELPEELFNLDILDGSPPCFTAETLVLTDDGYKPINEIKVGDKVWTHKNRFRSVYDFGAKKANNLISVKVMGCEPFQVTDNHPFYVRTMTRGNNRNFSAPCFKKAKDMSIIRNTSNTIVRQDFVGIPIIKEEEIPQYIGLERHYKTPNGGEYCKVFKSLNMNSPELWRFVGRWLADGWFRHDRKNTVICCGKKDEKVLEQILNDAGFKAHKSCVKQCYRYVISNVELYYFMLQFGEKADGKFISLDALRLPKSLLKNLIDGYLSADGHLDVHYNSWNFSTVSERLAYSLQMAIAKVYSLPTTMHIKDECIGNIEGRTVNCKKVYTSSFKCSDTKQKHSFVEDDYIWVPFRESHVINEEKTVYNMSVIEDNTYTVRNIAVHNCSTFSLAGNREQNWGEMKRFREGQSEQVLDTLFFDFIDLAKRLQPKVVVAENVKGLLVGDAKEYVRKIYQEFDNAGFYCQHFCLDASKMGVPQKRERVFFVCLRKDLAQPFLVQKNIFDTIPLIEMEFNEEPITFGEFADYKGTEIKSKNLRHCWNNRILDDNSMGDTNKRLFGVEKYFNNKYDKDDKVCYTFTSANNNVCFSHSCKHSTGEILSISTFPIDYDFGKEPVHYVCGMSVPPVMMAQVASNIYEQWLSKI